MSESTKLRQVDEELKEAVEAYSDQFWESRERDPRQDLHAYFQYPAMMVPGLQRRLIEDICTLQPMVKQVLDPFIGAGTTMTDCMALGLDLAGQDINPLAILICRVKKGPFFQEALTRRVRMTLERARSDKSEQIEADFPGLDKWFEPEIQVELSRIRRAIRLEGQIWARRFMWIALAETIRLTSNSRTSTYKLHIRPNDEIESRQVSAIDVFENTLSDNLDDLVCFKKTLNDAGHLRRGHYTGSLSLHLQDSAVRVVAPPRSTQRYDLLVTSPPYGDNTSTVPYGQHSYLPLQWIDLHDIDARASSEDWLRSTYEIDKRSLGGRRRREIEPLAQTLAEKSQSYATTADSLRDEPKDRCARVTTFSYDLDESLDPIVRSLRENAYMIWVVGNRHVGGLEIPTDEILVELLEDRGVTLVTRATRGIVFRRMATRNRISSMMRKEHILVFRKGHD
jgi:hypothetical protein